MNRADWEDGLLRYRAQEVTDMLYDYRDTYYYKPPTQEDKDRAEHQKSPEAHDGAGRIYGQISDKVGWDEVGEPLKKISDGLDELREKTRDKGLARRLPGILHEEVDQRWTT